MNSRIVKILTELGFDPTPKVISPEIQKLLDRVKEYEKEMGTNFDPKTLSKYLG